MPTYKAPLDDIRFVLFDLLQADKLAELPGFADATPDLVAAVLEAAGEFAANELQPINHSGDEEGCHYENGTVTTPKGFKEAYAKFIEGGWTSLPCDPEYGGQGLPKVINFAVEEMICSANLSFGMYPGLSNGAYNALHLHGTDEQKQMYLPKLVSGVWTGTMCLTEPHCGTDLGLIKTKAEPNGDGSHKISGTKIFISAGEHDLAGEHHPPGVGAAARCAGRHSRHLTLRLPEIPARRLRQSGPSQRGALWLHRAQDGHQGVLDLCDEFRRRASLAGGQAAQGHVGHVHHDERGAPRRRHAGPRPVGGRLSGCRHLRQGPAADALALRRQVSGQARRSHHRASRRAAHAA